MKHFFRLKIELAAIALIGVLLTTSCSQTIKETFLLPAGFQGRITVIFNQPNFQAIPVENGRRIYRIPGDGILITSSKFERGYKDQQYYYLENNGSKSEIPILNLNSHDIPTNPGVVDHGVTGVYGNSTDPNPLNFTESVIASEATHDSIYRRSALISHKDLIMKKVGKKF